MSKILIYINLGLEMGATVEAVIALFDSATAANPVTGAALQAAVTPGIAAVQAAFPGKVNVPVALVADVCNAIADAVATFHKATPTPAA